MAHTFDFFSYFSWLKRNLTKSEIVVIGVLKGVQMSVCSTRCIDLNNMLKILGTHFSYNRKLKEGKNLLRLQDIQRVLKIWKMGNLKLEGKIVIFKTIAISKIVFQSFITTVLKTCCERTWKITKGIFME